MPRAGLRSEEKVLKMMRKSNQNQGFVGSRGGGAERGAGGALRWRLLIWSPIPPLVRKLTLPFLTLKETLSLDTAVSERGEEDERDHL